MHEEIRYIEFQFADILGRIKGMIVPCEGFTTVADLQKSPAVLAGTSIDGSSITGMASVESSDLRLVADPDSIVELPYSMQRTAAVMCSVQKKMETADSESFHPKDARSVLDRVTERLLQGDMQIRFKVEPEFHFITVEGEPFDCGQYADIYPQNPSADVLLEIATAIQEMEMPVRVVHHEVGAAQLEIEISYEDALRAADNILRFKNLARAFTQAQGFDVTFMPKPFAGSAGNGMHCHTQLWKGDKNLFGAPKEGELSDQARSFVAGLLNHAPAITAIANPTVNSYKRLVPHHEAPVYICWGPKNRTALIRVPLFTSPSSAAIEFRSPDPMTNPYLLFSAIIAAGMDGMDQKLDPSEGVTEDVFAMTDKERRKKGIGLLPPTLSDALDELDRDDVLRDALGDELIEDYLAIKRQEWEAYISHAVTDWEWLQYSRN